MVLNVVLLSAIYTLITIFLLRVKNVKNQVYIFILTLIGMSLFCTLCYGVMRNTNKKSFDNDNNDNNNNDNNNDNNEENIKMEIKQKYETKCLSKYKPSNNDMLKGYIGRDCLDDGTCVIKPDKANLFPGYVNYDNTKKECGNLKTQISKDNLNSKSILAKPHCNNCGRILDLLNKPTSEDFKYTNPYDISHKCHSINPHKLSNKENVCIHCEQFY